MRLALFIIIADMADLLRTYTEEELKQVVTDLGQPSYRAKQLAEWLFSHPVLSYDEMTNLPAAMRSSLEERFPLVPPRIIDSQTSRDGSRKYVLELDDGCCIETVAIPQEKNRLSVCLSTQVGCALQCQFCATGHEGFTRNLRADEIIDQVIVAQNDFDMRVSHVLAMGQGEPFLNYDNLMHALNVFNDPRRMMIGSRHITISTSGIIDGIEKLADEPDQFTLAVSLHAAIQELRDELMPKVSSQPLAMLHQALISYYEKTHRRFTLEYALIDHVNDSPACLDALVDFCQYLHCHVNLIPLNSTGDSAFKPSHPQTISHWQEVLSQHRIETTVRISRGSDIMGACGQLKNSFGSDVLPNVGTKVFHVKH